MWHVLMERGVAYRVLVGSPDGRRPLGTSRRTLENNIKMDVQEVDWIDLAEDGDNWRAVVNTVMNLGVA
jgi:hypothetical protein